MCRFLLCCLFLAALFVIAMVGLFGYAAWQTMHM